MIRGWALVASLVLALAVASYAATRALTARSSAASPAACPGVSMLQDYLGLTNDQRSALSRLDAQFAQQRASLRQELWEARDRLLDVLRDPSSTLADAKSALERFGAAQQAMQESTVDYMFELRKHLTPEQRQKMFDVMGRGMCALTCGPGMGRGWGGRGRGPCGMGLYGPDATPGRRGNRR